MRGEPPQRGNRATYGTPKSADAMYRDTHRAAGPARKSGRGMFERFTDRTRRVVISDPASTLGVIVPEQLAVKTLLRAVVRQIPLDLVHFRIRRVLDRRRVLVDLAVIAQLVPNRQPLPVR